jgi:hypothetical protein
LTLVAKVKETRGIALALDEPVDVMVVQLVAGTDLLLESTRHTAQ